MNSPATARESLHDWLMSDRPQSRRQASLGRAYGGWAAGCATVDAVGATVNATARTNTMRLMRALRPAPLELAPRAWR